MNITQEIIDLSSRHFINKHTKIELLDNNLNLIDTIQDRITDGSITIDATSETRRTGSMTITLNPMDVSQYYSSILWIDKFFKIYIGIEKDDGEILWMPQGIFLVDQPSFSYSGETSTVSFNFIDMSGYISESRGCIINSNDITINEGESVSDVVKSTLTQYTNVKNYVIDSPRKFASVDIRVSPLYSSEITIQPHSSYTPVATGALSPSLQIFSIYGKSTNGNGEIVLHYTREGQDGETINDYLSPIKVGRPVNGYFSEAISGSRFSNFFTKIENTSDDTVVIKNIYYFLDTAGGPWGDTSKFGNDAVAFSNIIKSSVYIPSLSQTVTGTTTIVISGELYETIPHDLQFQEDTSPQSIISEINNLFPSFENYFNEDGIFYFSKIPSGKDDAIIFEFNEKNTESIVVNKDYTNLRNYVKVYGNYPDDGVKIQAEIFDDNPNSPLYIHGNVGILTKMVVDEDISTFDLAAQRAKHELQISNNTADSVSITCVPVFFLDVNRKISINIPNVGVSGNYLIQSIEIPFDESSSMSIVANKIYDIDEPIVDSSLILYLNGRSGVNTDELNIFDFTKQWTDRSDSNAMCYLNNFDGSPWDGKSLSFSKSDEYVKCNQFYWNAAAMWTLEFSADYISTGVIVAAYEGDSESSLEPDPYFWISVKTINDDSIVIDLYYKRIQGGIIGIPNVSLPKHFFIVHNGSEFIFLDKNGDEVFSEIGEILYAYNSYPYKELRIGDYQIGSASMKMYGIRIYGRVLQKEEIQNNYKSGF